MKGRPERAGFAIRIAAAILLAAVFGAGIWVGRTALGPKAPPEETPSVSNADPRTRTARGELEACREKLSARSQGRRGLSDAGAASEDAGRGAEEAPVTLEALEAERSRCKKSERLVSAEVCVAAARQYRALLSLPKDGLMCGPKSRAADLIEDNFAYCDALSDIPADEGAGALTKEEASLLEEARRVRETYPEDEVLRRLKEFVFTCTETPPKVPPGVDGSKLRRREEAPL